MRCVRGAIYDVIVDIDPESPTFLQWLGVELSAANQRMLYVPKGCAHGFQTLADDTEVNYLVSSPYAPEAGAACATTIRRWPSTGRCRSRSSPTGQVVAAARDAAAQDRLTGAG